MAKRVCVVAGGEWQAPIIEKLQSKGFEVLCINLYDYTKGAQIADHFELANVLDKETCLAIAKRYNIDAVLTDQSDISVPTVAYIAETLGLPGIGSDKALLFTDKYLMRQHAKKLGVRCPKFELVSGVDEAKVAAQEIGFPLVLKPTNSQGSRGVMVVRLASDLETAYKQCVGYTRENQSVLIEQFITGVEWTVEGYQRNYKHRSLCVSQKVHFENIPTVASSINYEPLNDSGVHQQIVETNNRLVEGLALPFGITHAEYKYEDGEFYLIEVAARGGGSHISSHMVPFMSGIDVNELLIEDAMNLGATINFPAPPNHYASLVFFTFAPGRVVSRTAEEDIEALPFVLSLRYSFALGDVLRPVVDDQSRHAQVAVTGASRAELEANIQAVKKRIEVNYE